MIPPKIIWKDGSPSTILTLQEYNDIYKTQIPILTSWKVIRLRGDLIPTSDIARILGPKQEQEKSKTLELNPPGQNTVSQTNILKLTEDLAKKYGWMQSSLRKVQERRNSDGTLKQ